MQKFITGISRQDRSKSITGNRGFFYGLLLGVFIVLVILRGSERLTVYKSISNYETAPFDATSAKMYNYTCGIQYWQSGKNFDNKDDLSFFSVLSGNLIPIDGKVLIIEFGANIGQFSEAVLGTPHKIPYVVHSIEPMLATFASLKNRSIKFKREQDDEHFHYNIAISDRPGRLPIYSANDISEFATLGKGLTWKFRKISEIAVTTLPNFIKQNSIPTPISFIKIDVEGFEPEVITGMKLEDNAHIFPLFSFETGGAWRDDRSMLAKNYTLKSFVSMLDDLGYDSFFIGNPYLLPISGKNWHDVFDGFVRAPNVLSALRCSRPWKNLLKSLRNISLDSCRWQ